MKSWTAHKSLNVITTLNIYLEVWTAIFVYSNKTLPEVILLEKIRYNM